MVKTLEVFLYAPRGPPVKVKENLGRVRRGCVPERFIGPTLYLGDVCKHVRGSESHRTRHYATMQKWQGRKWESACASKKKSLMR